MREKIVDFEKHFWSKVDKSPGNGPWGDCWIWTASLREKGYGQIGHDGKNKRSHRIAYELSVGPIPDGMKVLHKCDNPPCCNPNHLWIGTDKDNTTDMLRKEREARGERSGPTKLTFQQVKEIRSRLELGESPYAIAKDYNISFGNIYHIKKGNTWKVDKNNELREGS